MLRSGHHVRALVSEDLEGLIQDWVQLGDTHSIHLPIDRVVHELPSELDTFVDRRRGILAFSPTLSSATLRASLTIHLELDPSHEGEYGVNRKWSISKAGGLHNASAIYLFGSLPRLFALHRPYVSVPRPGSWVGFSSNAASS
jgi:hypothetical protein